MEDQVAGKRRSLNQNRDVLKVNNAPSSNGAAETYCDEGRVSVPQNAIHRGARRVLQSHDAGAQVFVPPNLFDHYDHVRNFQIAQSVQHVSDGVERRSPRIVWRIGAAEDDLLDFPPERRRHLKGAKQSAQKGEATSTIDLHSASPEVGRVRRQIVLHGERAAPESRGTEPDFLEYFRTCCAGIERGIGSELKFPSGAWYCPPSVRHRSSTRRSHQTPASYRLIVQPLCALQRVKLAETTSPVDRRNEEEGK